MGLTSTSTGTKVLEEDIQTMQEKANYTIAIAR